MGNRRSSQAPAEHMKSYLGSMMVNPRTRAKCRLLNVATALPRSRAVAATMRS